MDQQRDPLADHLGDTWMRVAQRIDAGSRYEIEIAGAIDVVNVAALAAVDDQRIAAAVLERVRAFRVGNGVGGEGR